MNLEKIAESLEKGEELCCQCREKGTVPLPERDPYIEVLGMEEHMAETRNQMNMP